MNKKIKIILMFLITCFIIAIGNVVEANSIESISMDIFIKENGDARIKETWLCNTDQGTEVYHPYYNLGKSDIINLEVSDEKNIYSLDKYWQTSKSFEEKKNRCGLNKISNGIEICWGISNYGTKVYNVEYTITNFVSELNDCQMFYWTLIPYEFSNEIGNAYIKIHANKLIPDDVDVWGYGNYGGTAYVYDGYIEMQSSGSLKRDEYMTILVKFPKEMFNLNNKINKDFNYYYEMAEEGTKHYEKVENKFSLFNSIMNLIIIFLNFLPVFVVLFIIVIVGKNNNFDFGPNGKRMPKELLYYRDIPCNKNLYRAYYIANKYSLLREKTDLLGAIILKWLNESLIQIQKKEVGFIFKKDETVIVLDRSKINYIQNDIERQLFKMLIEASKDGFLENKEFERWCNNNYSKILSWFDRIIKEEENNLISDGLIKCEKEKKFKIFTNKKYIATEELRNEAIKIAGLKKFLLDYTLINEREACEVKLFEEYLIIAQMLGIAKEVAREFKKLYPDIIEQSNYYSYDNIIFIQMCSSKGISRAYSAKSRAESYSSGGGGFSSGGGGGGSFGGRWRWRRIPLIKNKNND